MRARLSCLKCPACLQTSSTSKLLPCLHSMCQNCVDKCLKHSQVSEEKCYQFQCPICVKIVTKPPHELLVKQWAWHFPVNAVLMYSLQDTKTKVVQTCDPCMYVGESNTATSYCATCKELLCLVCDGVHRKSRATRQHTFLRLNENVEPAVAVTLAVSMTCTYHWNKDVEFYCVSHKSVCCSECLDYHRGCNEILKLKEHVDTLLKADELSKLTERMKSLEDHLDKFTKANDETQRELETSTEDMTTEIDKLIAILNEAKSRMSKEREGLLEGESQTRRSENQQCESLKATFRDFHHMLGAVVHYGDKHQNLVMLYKVKESLAYCEKTIQDNNLSVRHVGAKLMLNEHLISLRKLTGSQIAKIEVNENKLKLDPCVHQNCSMRSGTILTTTDEVVTSTTTSIDLGNEILSIYLSCLTLTGKVKRYLICNSSCVIYNYLCAYIY
ncbi:hypothetical protein ACJMK2_005323 [Sinanodonta woodiana]|uniref:Uncharacterized protein n=1 Tax=Sinanodonta woodiana TaxID=1069815 RepID=A0ABD3VST9_SINWO